MDQFPTPLASIKISPTFMQKASSYTGRQEGNKAVLGSCRRKLALKINTLAFSEFSVKQHAKLKKASWMFQSKPLSLFQWLEPLLFIKCIFIQQLQHVGTRKKEETQNQLAKSLQGTKRHDRKSSEAQVLSPSDRKHRSRWRQREPPSKMFDQEWLNLHFPATFMTWP